MDNLHFQFKYGQNWSKMDQILHFVTSISQKNICVLVWVGGTGLLFGICFAAPKSLKFIYGKHEKKMFENFEISGRSLKTRPAGGRKLEKSYFWIYCEKY